MRRPENAFAYGAASLIFIAALVCDAAAGVFGRGISAGAIGQWASAGMHAAFGHAAWLLPVWLGDGARRAWVGAPRDPRRVASWAFHLAVACMTLDLLTIPGGWIGTQFASILWTAVGIGAHVIAFGVWIVGGMRALGPRRVQQLAGQAVVISRQVLAHRPALLLPVSTQPLRAEVVEACAEPVPVPARAPLPEPEPIKPAPPAPPPPPPVVAPAPRTPSHWQLPDARLLPPPAPHHVDEAYLAQVAQHLASKLSSYEIRATVAPAREQGSLVYRFDITPAHGQKLRPIEDRQEDLESVFAGLRFVKQSGTGKLGVEIPVPESHRAPIQMREVLDSPAWTGSPAALALALGVTTSGKPVVIDLAEAPHLLVAGTTGAGKSVGLHAMLASLLLRHTPADLQLVLIDPKFVEFAAYRDLPHLRGPIANEQEDALALLREACDEMDARYRKFVDAGVRNIVGYNARGRDRMPRIVIVIEEYADLTSVNRDEVEAPICRLAQKARACGIHVILATQRPSTDVITGKIKANIDGRIAYRVASHQDSSTILGSTGAEKLMGRGDSLAKMPELGAVPVRVHGAYLEDVSPICDAWRAQTASSPATRRGAPPPLPPRAAAKPDDATCMVEDEVVELVADPKSSAPPALNDLADHYARAVAYARERGNISSRALVVMLRVGKNRADQLVDRMRGAGHLRPGGPNNSYLFVETTTT